MPYLPILGNHDVWSYDQVRGDLTLTPEGDTLFASTFESVFVRYDPSELTYPNSSIHNPQRNVSSRFQSWELRPSSGNLSGLTILAPDFNTRLPAPPPCPGHSPIGGCGVPGEAELHAFEGGVLSWMESRLDALGARRPANSSVLLLTHHPFRCRFPVPDWYFWFSTADKARLREAIDRRGLRHASSR